MANQSPWVRHCFHHLVASVWRRRPVLLAIVLVAAVVVLAFQYQSVSSPATPSTSFTADVPAFSLHRPVSPNFPDSAPAAFPKRNLSAMDLARDVSEEGQRVTNSDQSNNHLVAESVERRPGMRSDSGRFSDQNPVPKSSGPFIPQWKIVHVDLKGAPPRVSYFKQVLPLLRQAGANAILLEYEERFPFWGSIQSIASPNAYTNSDIRAILQLAKINELEVIPLVQTFGHMEFALKLEEFRHLREVDTFPMALCPAKNDSFTLVTSIIDQVMMFHPQIKFLHIGCDEVYHMGYCDVCRLKDRDTIFFDHVTRVARYVRDKYGVIPLIWDDMLRNMSPEKLRDMGHLVEPMVWTYVRDVYRFIPYSTWMTYSDVFPNIWAASAFKGAFGETLTVPNAKMHLENNEAWLEVMSEQHKNFRGSFRGIAITGWQRYDHLATLCELLPAGLPSLILNLLTVSAGGFDKSNTFTKFDQILQCPSRSRFFSGSSVGPDFDTDPYLWVYVSSCSFPGSNVFRLTQHTSDTVKRVTDYIYDVTIHKAWMTDYNIRRNMSNPFRVDEALSEHTGIYYSLTSLVREAEDALKEVFDKYVVAEWIEQNIYPYLLKMEKIMKDGIELKKARTWPRRPLPILPDLQRFLTSKK